MHWYNSSQPSKHLHFKVKNRNNNVVLGKFIVNSEHISHIFLVFLLLTLTSKCLMEEGNDMFKVNNTKN